VEVGGRSSTFAGVVRERERERKSHHIPSNGGADFMRQSAVPWWVN
jgi:hypothetical protein